MVKRKWKDMKSYTSLEQSKKLAEILPIESADMYYHNRVDIPDNYPLPIEWKRGLSLLAQEIPCWTLSGLLDILPEINGANLKFERVKAEDGYNGYYYHIEYEDKILIPYCKNPIDACVEMILKLNELKLL